MDQFRPPNSSDDLCLLFCLILLLLWYLVICRSCDRPAGCCELSGVGGVLPPARSSWRRRGSRSGPPGPADAAGAPGTSCANWALPSGAVSALPRQLGATGVTVCCKRYIPYNSGKVKYLKLTFSYWTKSFEHYTTNSVATNVSTFKERPSLGQTLQCLVTTYIYYIVPIISDSLDFYLLIHFF